MDRLHYHPLSPYSRKACVAGVLREEPFERVVVQLGTGALATPEFLAISPFGKIPVLETEEGPIVESTSIIEYWEARGGAKLIPPNAQRVARHFDRIGDLYLIAPVAALWWEGDSEAGKAAPEVASRAWALFGERLGNARRFIAGDAFTLGDLAGAIATDYFVRLGVSPPPAIVAWCERCFEVPAMRVALDEAMPFVHALHPTARAGG